MRIACYVSRLSTQYTIRNTQPHWSRHVNGVNPNTLSDVAWHVRGNAAFALGKIGDPTAVPALIGRLSDENMSVRIAAVFALGEIGDPAAVPVLITVLRNGEKDRTTLDLRFWATQTLEKIGTPEAMKAVKEHGVWMQDEAIDQG